MKSKFENKALRSTKMKRLKSSISSKVSTTTKARKNVKSQKPKANTSSRECQKIHSGGFCHTALIDLNPMPYGDVKFYLQKDRFLENANCSECSVSIASVFDKSKRSLPVLYYCNNSLRCFLAGDEDENTAYFSCDLILCSKCFWNREKSCARKSKYLG